MAWVIFWTYLTLFLGGVIGAAEEDGFLEGATCNQAQDCYINGGSELSLACFYSVNKCKCYSTISSIYHLSWDKVNKKCLSSKYGHCGTNGPVSVGCSDGFACIENRCRDPDDKTKTVKDAYTFPVKSCSACQFSPDLSLTCDYWTRPEQPACICKEQHVADGKSNAWSVRNYDGLNNCSVSQFGPCGTREGITIGCHGEGIECIDDVCINPKKPLSSLNEICGQPKNCMKGLICSSGQVCIAPKSSGEGVSCDTEEECQEGLSCKQNQWPWGYRRCTGKNESPPITQ